jgi:hypothetical protein
VSVPRAPLPHLVALLLGVGAAVAVGCGDRSNLIPAGKADNLTQQLSDIKSRIDEGDCDGITDDVRKFRASVTSLPGTVDRELRQRLREGADSLHAHAAEQCAQVKAGQTQTETTDTTTTETDTTPTETDTTETQTQTQTTATETTPPETTTEPTESEPPPTTEPDGVTGTTPDNGNGGIVPPDDGTGTP